LVNEYQRGATVAELTKRYEVHRTTILSILKEASVTRPPALRKLSDETVAAAYDLYETGLSLADVGKSHNVDAATIRREFIRASLTIRPRKGW